MTGSFKIIAATSIYSLGMENKQSVFRLRLKTSGIIIDRGNTGSIILLYRVTCIDHCTLGRVVPRKDISSEDWWDEWSRSVKT